uniref:NADH-ubiquinone oxidoreductase chain 6 n=1 Tax=Neobisnius villosulus TaxID=1143074 RepID=A0A0S2M7S8_9COLE|nr:NADH deshydrogenase subunit 6 [Neobisnius villosulus]
MMLLMSFLFSFLFIFLNHPLSMGVILLIQVTLIALISGSLSINFWFSYILFLIMVGGMLVLFIYMTSIASNEKFNFSNLLMLSLLIIFFSGMWGSLMIDQKMFSMMKFSSKFNDNYLFFMNLSKFFNYPSNLILFLLIVYLFITLIAVVKITNIKFGPLRQKF